MTRVLCVDASRASMTRLGVGRLVQRLIHSWSRQELPFDQVRVVSPAPLDDLPRDDRFVADVRPNVGSGILWQATRLRPCAARADAFFAPYVLPPGFRGHGVVYNLGIYTGPQAFPGWRAKAHSRHYAYSARRADLVFANCPTTRADLISAYGIEPAKIQVLAEGRDPEFRPARPVEEDAITDAVVGVLGADLPYFLFVGRAAPRRHVPELLSAFALLAGSLADHRLLLVGPDAPEVPVTRLAGELGIADRVRYVPYLEHDALKLLYRRARAFVTLSEKDGFPATLCEAMASGCPAVTLRGASLGMLEFLQGPRDAAEGGPLLEVADARPASVAEALRRLADDEALRIELGRRAERFAGSLATWDETAARIMEALTEVAERNGHR